MPSSKYDPSESDISSFKQFRSLFVHPLQLHISVQTSLFFIHLHLLLLQSPLQLQTLNSVLLVLRKGVNICPFIITVHFHNKTLDVRDCK